MSLCLDCGACCDGTMLEFADVTPAEAATLGEAIEVRGGALRQPCRALRGAACAVTEAGPSTCRAYRCLALQQLEAGEASEAEARAVVGELLRRRDEVLALMGGGGARPCGGRGRRCVTAAPTRGSATPCSGSAASC